MQYDVTQYPEGYEKVRDEELVFLPEDPVLRQVFMDTMLLWLLQW